MVGTAIERALDPGATRTGERARSTASDTRGIIRGRETMSSISVARTFFDAIQAGDLATARGLCADGFKLTQNGGTPMDADALIAFTRAVLAKVPDFRYEECVRTETTTGFVEEHRVRGTMPDGTPLDLAACVIADVVDGRVTSAREYLDGLAAAPLAKALA